MLTGRPTLLIAGVALSLGAIFFSSSSAAAAFCDDIFIRIFAGLTNHETRAATHFVLEKAVHVTLFLIFGLLMMNVVSARPARRIAVVFFSAVAVGSAAEYLQTFFAGRDPAIRDVVIDVCGASIGIAISLLSGPLTLAAVSRNH
jgi:VanZ family protein